MRLFQRLHQRITRWQRQQRRFGEAQHYLLSMASIVIELLVVIPGASPSLPRLADLTMVDNRYLCKFFETKLQENCPGRVTVEKEAPVAESQTHRLPSQSSSAKLGGGRATRSTSEPDSSTKDAADPTTGGARDLSPGARAAKELEELGRSAP